MAPESNNWLSFSLSSMEMLSSSSSHHHHPHHQQSNNMKQFVATNTFEGSSSADSHHYYFADNFFPHGWSNQSSKTQVMYTESDHHQKEEEEEVLLGLNNGESLIFQNYLDAQIHQQPAPKLEDFFGGDNNNHSSSLTHEDNHSSLTHIYNNYTNENQHQDLKNLTGFQTFSTNSGSEVDDSGTQVMGVESNNNNNDYNPLSLAVNDNAATQIMEKEKAIVVVAPAAESCKKISDTFGQRTSIYRGVTRHRWTGRYEAHLWDNSCRREGQARKGRQVYLGGYDKEDKAARAYDLAALKYWGPTATTNFPVSNYVKELEDMKNMTKQEFIASLRRKSSGFSRGASVYRGVTRHHQQGRWQARIGRVAGNKDLYLGTFATEEEAAEAYDIAAIKFRGVNAVTNFEMNRYDVEAIMQSALPVGGTAKRLKLSLESEQKSSLSNNQQQLTTQCTTSNNSNSNSNSSNINFGAMQPVSAIPCGVPFDATPAFYHHNFFHHFQTSNAGASDTSGPMTTMAAAMPLLPSAADLFIWPHQSY